MNPGSVYSIQMVASDLSGIVVNAHLQRAFVIGILAHHLEGCCWIPVLGTSCPHRRHFEQSKLHFGSLTTHGSTLYYMRQQDNGRLHIASFVWNFLDTENFRRLPWPARSPVLSPTENFWPIVTERLTRNYTPVTTIDELWCRVEAAWAYIPVHAIQSLFDSMPGMKILLLLPEVVVLSTDFSKSMHQNFLKH
ncbi:transposable element Tcb1 transposase [Trichonephila clavipes]|nr:transposable element Tcb1 transposase [Trichonephila clavipes]